MANILFVESDPIAIKAFTGIMNRSVHKLTTVSSVDEAWEALKKEKFFDLIILEVRLDTGNGRQLISEVREHLFFAKQNILVYSKMSDKRSIRQILILDIQNFLLKPYDDEKLYAEINRAHQEPWWTRYFESEIFVCDRLGVTPEELEKQYRDVIKQLRLLPKDASQIGDDHLVAILKMQKLLQDAGFPVLEKFARDMEGHIKEHRGANLLELLPMVPQAIRLLEERITPGRHAYIEEEKVPDSPEEEKVVHEKTGMGSIERVCSFSEMQQKIAEMDGYPVVDSVAASFQMAAANPDIEIQVLAQMIETDPCLATQVIYYCNAGSNLAKGEGQSDRAIGDPKQAIQMFGLSRIRAVASSIPTIPEESLEFRGFGWKQYWMFQIGCAMLSQEIVRMLSLPLNENIAYFGGLVHEMGKIIFAYHYPEAFETAMKVAASTSVPLTETEKHFFGCTHEEVGKIFAEQSKLPPEIASCCGFYRSPEKAPTEHREMVAVIALADYLCKLFEIGFSGSRLPKNVSTFAGHPSWQILKPILYHGFTVAKFERACKERVQMLKRELLGLSERKH